MVARRTCRTILANGEPCRAAPRVEGNHCFWHDPETADDAQQARRLGGQRRRREGVVSGAYDFQGLATVPEIRRILEVAAIDTLGLDNGVQRNRTLVAVAQAATRLMEVGELADRVAELEAAMAKRPEPLRAVAGGRR
jgi:hypothetical protein